MAFKMTGMSFGEGTGSPNKKAYGTSVRDLSDLSYKERSEYRSWKKAERQTGNKGAHSDNTYEAYLRSGKNKKRKSRKGWSKIGDFFKNIFKPRKGSGGTLPSTIAEKKVHEDFLNKGITGSAKISDLKDRGHDMWNRRI